MNIKNFLLSISFGVVIYTVSYKIGIDTGQLFWAGWAGALVWAFLDKTVFAPTKT